MPVFRITYASSHDTTEAIEWVTDRDWDAERTLRKFEERHPGAAVIHCQELWPVNPSAPNQASAQRA